MDPTLLCTSATEDPKLDRTLQKRLTYQARATSHPDFVTVSLQTNVVPKGLRLATTPQVLAPLTPQQGKSPETSWKTALNETSLRLLNILRVFYKYYNSEVSCRILLRREEILSSSNSTHDQAVFHFTASKVDKDVAKQLSERRKE